MMLQQHRQSRRPAVDVAPMDPPMPAPAPDHVTQRIQREVLQRAPVVMFSFLRLSFWTGVGGGLESVASLEGEIA